MAGLIISTASNRSTFHGGVFLRDHGRRRRASTKSRMNCWTESRSVAASRNSQVDDHEVGYFETKRWFRAARSLHQGPARASRNSGARKFVRNEKRPRFQGDGGPGQRHHDGRNICRGQARHCSRSLAAGIARAKSMRATSRSFARCSTGSTSRRSTTRSGPDSFRSSSGSCRTAQAASTAFRPSTARRAASRSRPNTTKRRPRRKRSSAKCQPPRSRICFARFVAPVFPRCRRALHPVRRLPLHGHERFRICRRPPSRLRAGHRRVALFGSWLQALRRARRSDRRFDTGREQPV